MEDQKFDYRTPFVNLQRRRSIKMIPMSNHFEHQDFEEQQNPSSTNCNEEYLMNNSQKRLKPLRKLKKRKKNTIYHNHQMMSKLDFQNEDQKKCKFIPIRLESGEEIYPKFTKLEDSILPPWCAFGIMDHQKGAREKLVPLSMDSNKSQESTDNNASTDDQDCTDLTDNPDHLPAPIKFKTTKKKESSSLIFGKPPSGLLDRSNYKLTSQSTSVGPKDGTKVSNKQRSSKQKREKLKESDLKTFNDIEKDISRMCEELRQLDNRRFSNCPPEQVKISSYTAPVISQPERISTTSSPKSSMPNLMGNSFTDISNVRPASSLSDNPSASNNFRNKNVSFDFSKSNSDGNLPEHQNNLEIEILTNENFSNIATQTVQFSNEKVAKKSPKCLIM